MSTPESKLNSDQNDSFIIPDTKNFINIKDNIYLLNKEKINLGNSSRKNIYIQNISLNKISESYKACVNDYIDIIQNDFLGKKREQLLIKSEGNIINSNYHNNIEKDNSDFKEETFYNQETISKNLGNNFYLVKNKLNNNNNSIKKIGAKIIKASPTDSPVLNNDIQKKNLFSKEEAKNDELLKINSSRISVDSTKSPKFDNYYNSIKEIDNYSIEEVNSNSLQNENFKFNELCLNEERNGNSIFFFRLKIIIMKVFNNYKNK